MLPRIQLVALRSRLVAVGVAAILVGVVAPPSHGAGGSFDVRGNWKFTYVCAGFPNTHLPIAIFEVTADGRFNGKFNGSLKGIPFDVTGTVKGADFQMVTQSRSNPHWRTEDHGTLQLTGTRLTVRGTWSDLGCKGAFSGTLVSPLGPNDNRRPTAAMVICNRDMTAASDAAVLECTAMVADALPQPGSRAPTGTIAWTTQRGALSQSTCVLTKGQGSTSWCAVRLIAQPGVIPIGTAPPVTAKYPGDTTFDPSSSSPELFGRPSGYTASDDYGPSCNDGGYPQPTFGCGDPVNPATGNLSMTVVDTAAAGRGPGLALARTYNSLAASADQNGRFGVGWSDNYGAHLVIGPSSKATVVLGTGATVPFTASGAGFKPAAWVTATLSRTADKRYLFTLASQATLTFDPDGRLVAVSDRSMEPVTLEYTADGMLATVTDRAGRTLSLTHDSSGRITQITDPAGRSVVYAYDATGNLVAVTDVAGGVTRYEYDEQHRLMRTTDPISASASTAYDDMGRVVQQLDPLGNRLAFEYQGKAPDQITVVTDGNGHRSAYEYSGGLLVSNVDGLGSDVQSTTSYIYDERGAQVGMVDGNHNLWRTIQDSAGNILRVTDPLGRRSTATYDSRNNQLIATTPLGITTGIEYDAHNQATRIVHAAGTPDEAEILVAHEDVTHPSDVTSVTDPLGAVTRWTYDAYGDVLQTTDALGSVSTATYDVLGQVTATTDATGATTTVVRNIRGEITSVMDPLGHTISATYDADGNVVSQIDAAGHTTTRTTDAAGRPALLTLADGTSQAAGRDGVGALLSQTNALGSVTTMTYDALGRVSTWADALGGSWQLGYDAIGHVTTVTDPTGAVTTYTYDAAGQLIGSAYGSDTPAVTYAYDSDGRRISMTDATGTSAYEWDARSRLVRTTDGAGHSVSSIYDLRGGLVRLVYPDGLAVEHDYDALGRIISIRDGVGHHNVFIYDPVGRLVRAELGNGVTTDRANDANGWVSSITSTSPVTGSPFATFAYQRDATGRPATITDSTPPQPLSTAYDVRGRLTALGTDTFQLDAAGNLTGIRGQSLSYDAAGRLQTAVAQTTVRYSFDAAGRRIAQAADGGGSAGYAYDGAGRLIRAEDVAGGMLATYDYNGDGLRTSATDAAGATSTFTWHQTGGAALLLGDGTSRFIYGPGGMPLEQIDSTGTATWFHSDDAGNIRALTAADGSVVATFSWDAYGNATNQAGLATTRLGFKGQYTDPGTGFQYLQARFYDPATAQFLTIDPNVVGTHHPYAFAAGDPLSFSDPTGLDPKLVPGNTGKTNVLAGHGLWNLADGYVTVPAGTTVIFHSPVGSPISDPYGVAIEQGKSTSFNEVYGPGSRIPNYTLSPPSGLLVLPTSARVSRKMQLSTILKPGMGSVDWAACRSWGKGAGIGRTVPPAWHTSGPVDPSGPVSSKLPNTWRMTIDPAWYDWDSGSQLPGA